MKTTFQIIISLIILTAILSSCKKEEAPTPCADVICENNGTVNTENCTCECVDDFFGENCELKIPTDGLVTWYPFNNGSAIDGSAYTNNGIINDALPTEDRFGNPNAAFYFDGTASIISEKTDLNLTTESTASVWIKTTNSDLQLVATKYIAGEGETGFQILSGDSENERRGEALCAGRDGNIEYKTSGYSGKRVDNDQWHLITGIINNQQLSLFVDGVLMSQKNYADTQTSLKNDQPIRIGGMPHWPNPWHFNGSVDDFRLYNRALSEEEINILFRENNF